MVGWENYVCLAQESRWPVNTLWKIKFKGSILEDSQKTQITWNSSHVWEAKQLFVKHDRWLLSSGHPHMSATKHGLWVVGMGKSRV